jgi:alpha-L-rhamnosidase
LDLADESLVANIQQKLVERVEATGCHLGTGFLSTPFLCNVLSEMGRTDLAYAVLLQEGVPSWLYAINHGATTIWEDWDGVREDGTVSASLNHYSKGAVVSWFYEYMCGIQMDENSPAYHHFFLKPQPGGGLTNASAGFTSMYGRIESSWEIKDSATIYSFTVPANSSATVELPGNAACEGVAGVSDVQYAKGKTVFNLASGKYIFTCR